MHVSPCLPSSRPSFLLPRSCLLIIVRVKLSIHSHHRRRHTVPSLFARTAKLHPNKPALIYETTGEVSGLLAKSPVRLSLKSLAVCLPAGLELQGAAGEMPRRGSLGAGPGLGRGGRCGSAHGKPASGGGSVVGPGHGWRGSRFHQPQPSAEPPAALHQHVPGSGNSVWSRDDRRFVERGLNRDKITQIP